MPHPKNASAIPYLRISRNKIMDNNRTLPFSRVAFFALAFLLLPLTIRGQAQELKLSSLFTDHMVLQRDQPVPVWGMAKSGAEITVEFAQQKKTTKAEANGQWLVKLDPMPASLEGRELVVNAGSENPKITLSDVVVGDVWLCSGQSNMHFTMKRVHKANQEIAATNNPAIRFFYVEPQFSLKPGDSVLGSWQSVSPETVERCSAVAYYFARDLQVKVGVPIGLVTSSVGGTRIETWMQPKTLSGLGLAGPLIDKWKNVPAEEFRQIDEAYRAYQDQIYKVYPDLVRTAKSQGLPVPPEPTRPEKRLHDCPGALHNGMIAPLQPFAIRGALWYQGESNIGSHGAYEKMLPALIADWRKVWGREMPFLVVQLAPHESCSPAFREAQFRIWQKTAQTALVVTTDVGDAKDIHPTRKQPVGERLALAARALSYGEKIEYSGPVFLGMSVVGSRAVISFSHVGEGLMAKGDALKGFVVAGSDGKFFPAQAVIEGSTVVVTSDQVTKPAFVHYGNDKVPDVNLYNRNGLPAVPFRSDMPSGIIPITQLSQP
jgi:sialate O-acetylesterase